MKICFPNHIGLPGQPQPPSINGYVEPEEFTVEPVFGSGVSQVDPGWTQSSRITYVADTAVGAGRPLMVFQGLKHNSADSIYLSFVARRDTAFDEQDRIILVFHPNYAVGSASKTGDERRIDIFPNAEGVGAGSVTSPANPDDFSGMMGGQSVTIRANREPRNVEYSRWNTVSNSWASIPAPSGVEIRVRSWDLGENNKNWSVEIRLPTTIAAGGANWIDLTGSFGFYFNVIRVCTGGECTFGPTLFDGAAFQFTWPRANYTLPTSHLITGEMDVGLADIPPNWLGEAFLGNVPGCASVTGVKFHNGNSSSIGVLSPSSSITSAIQKSSPNTFVARVQNDGPVLAQSVETTFRIANWGIGPGDVNKWNLVPATGGTNNPTPPQNIPTGGAPVDLTMQWALTAAEQAMYGSTLSTHQCIWALLDSVQAVDFVQSSIRRNMDFTPLSSHEQTAEVSGDGYPDPPENASDQDFALIVSQMLRARLVLQENGGQKVEEDSLHLRPGVKNGNRKLHREPDNLAGRLLWLVQSYLNRFQVVYEWVWIMDGYRKTEFALTTGSKKYEIYQPAGAFGYIGEHEGLVSAWEQSVSAAPGDENRLDRMPNNAYRLRVPNGGNARIITRLEAKEFKAPWWFWLLLLLLLPLLLILWLIQRLRR
jgi:hypothetical protein